MNLNNMDLIRGKSDSLLYLSLFSLLIGTIFLPYLAVPFLAACLIIFTIKPVMTVTTLSFLISWDYVMKYNVILQINILGFNFIKLFFAVCVLSTFVMLFNRVQSKKIPALVGAYIGLILFTSIIIHGESINDIQFFLNLILYFIFVYYLLAKESDVINVLKCFIIGNVIPSIIVILNVVLKVDILSKLIFNDKYYLRPLGFIGNPNMFALYNLVSMIISVSWLFNLKNRKNNKLKFVLLFINVLLTLMSVYLSTSRGALLTMAIVSVLFFFSLSKKQKIMSIPVTAIVLIATLLFALSSMQSDRLNIFKNQNNLRDDISYDIRVKLIEKLDDIITQNPIVGIGSVNVYQELSNSVGEGNAQNTYSHLWASYGLFALIVFITLVGHVLIISYRLHKIPLYKPFFFIMVMYFINFFLGTFEDDKLLWLILASIMSLNTMVNYNENKSTIPN